MTNELGVLIIENIKNMLTHLSCKTQVKINQYNLSYKCQGKDPSLLKQSGSQRRELNELWRVLVVSKGLFGVQAYFMCLNSEFEPSLELKPLTSSRHFFPLGFLSALLQSIIKT